MLVLSRKTGQKLIINDNIELVVLETRGEFVKLGINAPRNVSIYREEIYEEIKQVNQQSLDSATSEDVDAAVKLLRKNISIKNNKDISDQFKLPLNKVDKENKDNK